MTSCLFIEACHKLRKVFFGLITTTNYSSCEILWDILNFSIRISCSKSADMWVFFHFLFLGEASMMGKHNCTKLLFIKRFLEGKLFASPANNPNDMRKIIVDILNSLFFNYSYLSSRELIDRNCTAWNLANGRRRNCCFFDSIRLVLFKNYPTLYMIQNCFEVVPYGSIGECKNNIDTLFF